jgi:hypothetical protein
VGSAPGDQEEQANEHEDKVLILEQSGHRFRFDLGHSDVKPATRGVAITRPVAGRIPLLVI